MADNATSPRGQQCPTLVEEFIEGHLYSQTVVTAWYVASAINSVSAVLTVLLNALVIWAILENHRLRTSTYHLTLAVQSGADLFVGHVTQPLFVASTLCRLNNCFNNCSLFVTYYVVLCIGACCSVISLVMLSLERYIALQYPLRYQDIITVKRLLLGYFTCCTLIGSVLVSMILTIKSESQFLRSSVQTALIVPCIVFIFISYIKVYRTTCKHMKAITSLLDRFAGNGEMSHRRSRLQELKRTFTTGIVLAVFVLTYSPILLLRLVVLIKGRDWSLDYNLVTYVIWTTLFHLQSLINPFIFSVRQCEIRRAIRRRIPLLNRLPCTPCCGSHRNIRRVLPVENIVAGG